MKDQVQYSRSHQLPGLVLGEARLAKFRFKRHFHLDYHIGVITEGVQRQILHGENMVLTPGTIQLMPPGEMHDGFSADDGFYTLKTFRVAPEMLDGLAQEISGSGGQLGDAVLLDPAAAQRLSRLHAAFQGGETASPLQLQADWLTLLEHLLSRTRLRTPEMVHGELSASQRARVREYCEARLADKISLDELAALCGIERFKFLKLFKRTTGMTPHAWLVRLRLERACTLMTAARQDLTQVAHAVGFYDQSHFNRAFSSAYGVAPSRY
ncbi:AraC family transcriptional regulator [Janthinobacterium sp.]|uniref:AraC family transcriptional regulator n=1 Tax=Janthinobacterium sp. TaxID=1871054 RepID=UPI0026329672|nr:AraC family transcriptional regulator [Janthinobacterium sp.]